MQEEISIDETKLGRQRAQLKNQKKEELAAFAKGSSKKAAQILELMSPAALDDVDLDSDLTVIRSQPWLQ